MVKKPEPKEKEIERGILQWLNMQPGILAWKIQNTGIPDPRTGKLRTNNSPFSMKGMADIQAIWCGLHISIEVKRPSRRSVLSDLQKKYLEDIHNMGGVSFVATSIEEVQKHLKELQTSTKGKLLWILFNRPSFELENLLKLYEKS